MRTPPERSGRRAVLRSALALAVAGCGQRVPAWRIGFLADSSDDEAPFVTDARNGAMFAVDRINAAGGVRGRPLQLLVESAGGAAGERAAAHRLIDAKVEAVVGPYTSPVALRLLPLFNAARVLLVSPTLSGDSLARQDDYLVCLNASALDGIGALAGVLRAHGWRSVAVLRDLRNAAATLPWSDRFRQSFVAGGGAVVQEIDFGADGEIVFLALARRALARPVDGLLLLAGSVDAARLAQQVAKLAPGLPLAAAGWAAHADLVELGGRAVEGLVFLQPHDPADGSPRYSAMRDAFAARFGGAPGFAAVSSFDAVGVLATALERAAAGESVRDAVLRHGPYQGAQQVLAIDRFGDTRRTMVPTVVRDGRFVPL